jgi:hypothetical protein
LKNKKVGYPFLLSKIKIANKPARATVPLIDQKWNNAAILPCSHSG